MTRHTRRIMFYSLIALFAIIAPVIIAYSLGYAFHFGTRSVEKIGGIFLKSRTPRLSIFLDGEFVKQTSYLSGDALLTDLPPGTHLLRLEKADFSPWSAAVTVEPTLVTDLRKILLIPNPPPIATSTKDELSALRASATTGSFKPVAPKETVSVPDLSAPPFSPSFFLDSKKNVIGKTATTSKVIVGHVNSLGVFDTMFYFIDKNGFLGKFDSASKQIITIGRPGFYLSEKPAHFFQSPRGDLVILDASGGLFLSDGSTTITPLVGGVAQIAFDSTSAKVLVQRDQAVDVVWLEDNSFQPFQPKATREQVFATDVPIQDADWFFDDDAHIIIRTQDGIFFTGIDTRGLKNVVQLFKKKTDELITIPSLPRSLFFRRGKTFFTITI